MIIIIYYNISIISSKKNKKIDIKTEISFKIVMSRKDTIYIYVNTYYNILIYFFTMIYHGLHTILKIIKIFETQCTALSIL